MDDNDWSGYCAALAEGFIVDKEGIAKWLACFDRESMRVLRYVAVDTWIWHRFGGCACLVFI